MAMKESEERERKTDIGQALSCFQVRDKFCSCASRVFSEVQRMLLNIHRSIYVSECDWGHGICTSGAEQRLSGLLA